MKNRIRLVGIFATALFAAGATGGCAGSSNIDLGTGGSSATGGQTGGGTGGTGTGGTGSGGTGTGGTGTGGSGAGGTGTGGAKGGSGGTGTGGTGTGGTATGGAGGTAGHGTGGSAGAGTGGAAGAATGGSTGTGGSGTSSCLDDIQNGSETGVDCGGSCPACPSYKINGPTAGGTVASGCQGGPAFMCTRSMVYSPEFKVAETDDFSGTGANPAFVYAVAGHDKNSSGLDSGESGNNSCCQCYQLVFTSPRDPVTNVTTPKPMIVQAFNTGVDGSGVDFDIYMASGGEGSNTAGCTAMYTSYPTIGQPNNGGIRAENVSQCAGSMNAYSGTSIATMSCQSAIASDCDMITSTKSATIQSESQVSCEETNQAQNFYHMNWNVMAKRIECPANLTRVTGCKLNSQGLPAADPTAVDSASASGKGFSSGYTTTTMQDCCRPTCAYKANVSGADSTYNQFYVCDSSDNPS
jgi:hypothetical protein